MEGKLGIGKETESTLGSSVVFGSGDDLPALLSFRSLCSFSSLNLARKGFSPRTRLLKGELVTGTGPGVGVTVAEKDKVPLSRTAEGLIDGLPDDLTAELLNLL